MDIKDYLHFYIGCELSDGLKLDYYRFLYGNLKAFENGKIKPILRPMSDMMEEESIHLGWSFPIDKENADVYLKEINVKTELLYLLKQGFDLFGLIEAGLAIDKTKLK